MNGLFLNSQSLSITIKVSHITAFICTPNSYRYILSALCHYLC